MRGKRHLFGLQLGATKVVSVLALAGIVAGGSYAFTASNTVAGGNAGEGESTALTGFTASNTIWTLDTTNPDQIQKVEFDLASVTDNTVVYAGSKPSAGSITWANVCTTTDVTGTTRHYSCTFGTQPTANGTQNLAVSAVN
jgi:hypothetical protein